MTNRIKLIFDQVERGLIRQGYNCRQRFNVYAGAVVIPVLATELFYFSTYLSGQSLSDHAATEIAIRTGAACLGNSLSIPYEILLGATIGKYCARKLRRKEINLEKSIQ